jgi:hypothetical protein
LLHPVCVTENQTVTKWFVLEKASQPRMNTDHKPGEPRWANPNAFTGKRLRGGGALPALLYHPGRQLL